MGTDTFVELNPNHPARFGHPYRYRPSDFEVGDEVTLYLAWSTTQDISIRRGIVVNPNAKKSDGVISKDALMIQVEESGILERREPRDVSAINCDGYTVCGRLKMRRVSSYTRSYLFHCITRADIRS